MRMNIKKYLTESVFYPCSGATTETIDLSPVGGCVDISRKFVLVDVEMDKNSVQNKLANHGLEGYGPAEWIPLTPQEVFGCSWKQLACRHPHELALHREAWHGRFILLANFVRLTANEGPVHLPPIQIMFIPFFGVAAYTELYVRNQISPTCLIHKHIGWTLREGYISHLYCVLRANPAGLPMYFLHGMHHDHDTESSEHLPLDEFYRKIKCWRVPHDRLTLLRLTQLPLSRHATQKTGSLKNHSNQAKQQQIIAAMDDDDLEKVEADIVKLI